MKQVTIVGLGLIGSSLGLALKQLKVPPRVVGNDNQYDAALQAQKLKAVDKLERHPLDAVADSDLVIVATPVGTIPSVLESIAGGLADGCIVTDTGSTKREIIRRAGEILPPGVAFVGGHPMTGKATAGVDQPDASLFREAVYCVTPSTTTPGPAVATVVDLIQQIGAEPYFLDPAEHDGLVAGISHLPYLLSAALMRTLASQPGWREMSGLAAGGFDTATRLSGQNPRMYGDILASNADNVVRHLDGLMQQLAALRESLQSGNAAALLKELEEIQRQRAGWEEQRRREAAERG
ncbi:MAG: prephenate dehydrogenase [Chloroflexota bacterium]